MDENIIEVTEQTFTDIARMIARREEVRAGLSMYEAQYMQHAEAYARTMNELYDLDATLKEVGL